VGNADGEGQERDDSLVHKRFVVNEYLVEANTQFGVGLRAVYKRAGWDRQLGSPPGGGTGKHFPKETDSRGRTDAEG